ncbi:MAG: NADH-quinone oxidoreductase subunit M [Planctomycetota bacterium]
MTLMLLVLIPVIAALGVIGTPRQHVKWVALIATVINFLYSVILAYAFKGWGEGGFFFVKSFNWLESFGVSLGVGADSVSMLLVLLSTMLMPLCVWGSFSAIQTRVKEYYAWLLVIEAAMIGVFIARDLIFFYICFEFTLIPMYFLIALFGSNPMTRVRTATKFFIYTFTGSILTLAGLIYVAWACASQNAGVWTFDIGTLTAFAADGGLTAREQGWILLAMLAGFGVKIPLFPVHTWLPLAHTEAPTAGSVILAAVLLKLGTYGLYRFLLPIVPDAVITYGPAIAVLAIIGILYAALICWVQTDVKRLVAYSSVSHLGFCVLGLIALNPLGLQGSVLYMINHGLSTGALFFLIGMVYERYHTRDMNEMGGLARRMPVWSTFMVFFVLASVGLPGLNGFVSEFLCLIAAFTATPDNAAYPGVLGPWYAAIAGVGMIFAAMYLLIMVGKVVFGPLKEPRRHAHDHDVVTLPADLTAREIGVLAPLAVLCVVLGFQPGIVTSAMEPAIEETLAVYPERVLAVEEIQTAGAQSSSMTEVAIDG